MAFQWIIQLLIQYEMIILTSPSITGVTYMDHFDFEERYRDLNECNPLYWHPLHLPAYCMGIYEQLIRSRIASRTPVRVMRRKEKKKKYHQHHTSHHPGYTYPEELYEFPYPLYEIASAEYEADEPQYPENMSLTPYGEMLELLKKDIKKAPSSPTVTVMPNLGPVAVYDQVISRKSEDMIRAVAEAIVKATRKTYDEYYATYEKYPSDKNLFVYDSAKNKTDVQNGKKKKDKRKKLNGKDKDNKMYKVKTKHGNVVTIIETKNPEIMKNDPFFP